MVLLYAQFVVAAQMMSIPWRAVCGRVDLRVLPLWVLFLKESLVPSLHILNCLPFEIKVLVGAKARADLILVTKNNLAIHQFDLKG